jgi:hypothetical protein
MQMDAFFCAKFCKCLFSKGKFQQAGTKAKTINPLGADQLRVFTYLFIVGKVARTQHPHRDSCPT